MWRSGLVALLCLETSQTRDRTRVTYTGRQMLIHCTTRARYLNYRFKNGFMYVFGLRWAFTAACGLSLVVASRGRSLVTVGGLLSVVASLLAEQGL